MSVVIIEEKAFMSMLISAVECFPEKYKPGKTKKKKGVVEGEVFGLLFGQRFNRKGVDHYNVSLAIPNQIVDGKTDSSVTPSWRYIERIREVAELFPAYQYLGNFHSHPWRKDEFNAKEASTCSKADTEFGKFNSQMEEDHLIMAILGLTCFSKKGWKKPVKHKPSQIINNCGNYQYSLSCYETVGTIDDDMDFPEVGNIICPAASGMTNQDFK